MRKLKTNILLLTLVVIGCNQTSRDNYRDKYSFDNDFDMLTFNKTQWSLVDTDDLDFWYKREHMMKDLLDNNLKLGMTKKEILDLLGQPYAHPSTYSFRPNYTLDAHGTAYKLYGDSLYAWLNRQQDTTMSVLKYNRGFSGSGPNLLIIVLDKDDKAVDFLTADAI